MIMSVAQMETLVLRIDGAKDYLASPPGFYLKWIFGHFFLRLLTSFGFLTFGMVKKERWWIVSSFF